MAKARVGPLTDTDGASRQQIRDELARVLLKERSLSSTRHSPVEPALPD